MVGLSASCFASRLSRPPPLISLLASLVQDWLWRVLPQGAGPDGRAPARQGGRARLGKGPVGAPHPVRVAQLRHVLQGDGCGGGAAQALPSAHAVSVVHSECAKARPANGLLDKAQPLGRVAQKARPSVGLHGPRVCAPLRCWRREPLDGHAHWCAHPSCHLATLARPLPYPSRSDHPALFASAHVQPSAGSSPSSGASVTRRRRVRWSPPPI